MEYQEFLFRDSKGREYSCDDEAHAREFGKNLKGQVICKTWNDQGEVTKIEVLK